MSTACKSWFRVVAMIVTLHPPNGRRMEGYDHRNSILNNNATLEIPKTDPTCMWEYGNLFEIHDGKNVLTSIFHSIVIFLLN